MGFGPSLQVDFLAVGKAGDAAVSVLNTGSMS